MKTNLLKKAGTWLLTAMLTLWNGTLMAQQKVNDEDLHGVWLMESFYYEGEDKVKCGVDYTQIKVYRPNGEYACAEVVKLKNGQFQILPHEYGTYTFKNGKYTEMGRDGILNLVDKNTFTGQWMNRHDVWKKCTATTCGRNALTCPTDSRTMSWTYARPTRHHPPTSNN